MLSVLIPIYNYDVVHLVKALVLQAEQLTQAVEIICFDDGSSKETLEANGEIVQLSGVSYTELPHNMGRAAIRNALARAAQYDSLLFLDCDSGILSTTFLRLYLQQPPDTVVVGGRIYQASPPTRMEQKLHWTYGSARESRSLATRRAQPYIYFHSNNFMIPRQLFLDTLFSEDLQGYGYEDLVFAKAIAKKQVKVLHIDNPVQHLDIEDTTAFLRKTRNAVANLKQLNSQGIMLNTKLEKAVRFISGLRLEAVFKSMYLKRKEQLEHNLRSADPKLRNLDYYKLYTYLDS